MIVGNPGRHMLQSVSYRCRVRGICTTRHVRDNKVPAVRRFWRSAGVDERSGKYVVTLDNRPIKTPNGTAVELAPSQKLLAWLIAGEWETQSEFIGAHSLPLTSLVCRSIDGLGDTTVRADVVDKLLKYFHTDSACLHEKYPSVLVELQQRHYIPIVEWARKEYGIEISLTSDMFALQQTRESTETLRTVLAGFSPLKLAALEKATMSAKSLLIGLALVEHHVTAEDAAMAAQVETNAQTQLWGLLENAHDIDNAALRQILGASACATIGA
ncbi:chaperone [Coemansia sp. RSA 2337]|nr:chaperone [Coemansia sp. RSA 2337]